jgi:hypothetical protein
MATIIDTFVTRMVTWEKKITQSRFGNSGKLENSHRRNVLTVV